MRAKSPSFSALCVSCSENTAFVRIALKPQSLLVSIGMGWTMGFPIHNLRG